MQLDTRLPLAAAAQAPITFQPESRMQTLSRIAPGINAMRQLRAQQINMETELRKRQAFDQFRSAAQKAGLSGDLGQLAQVFFTHGQSAEHFKLGTELMKASQEEARNRRLFGSAEGGEPAGTMPAATLAAAAPATIQAPASEVAPEMAFGAAGGAQPRNAMMAMEAPTAPAAPAAPTRAGGPQSYSFAGRTWPAPVVQEMLASDKHRPLALEIIKANEPKQDEIANRMLKMGLDPSKQSDWVRYHEISRAPESSPEIVKLQAQVEALPANDPRRRALQDRINILTTRPEPVRVNVDARAESAERVERAKQLVKDYNDVATAARVARRSLMSIEGAQGVLDRGFATGFGTETIAKAASVLAALGVPSAEKYATSAQTFLSEARKVLLDRQLEQKGPQTENDAKRIDESFVRLGNTPEANRFILAVAKAQAEQSSEQQKFYDAFYRRNKTYDGAEEAWLAGDGSKSIFQRPSLRSFVVPQTGAAPGRPPLQQIFGR